MTKEIKIESERRRIRGEMESGVDESEPWIAPFHTWHGWPSDSTDWLSSQIETPAEPNARLDEETEFNIQKNDDQRSGATHLERHRGTCLETNLSPASS